MDQSKNQGELETWAIVEIMGHQRVAGFARTVSMGSACMIRVDVPELPTREESYMSFDTETGQYFTEKRKLPPVPAFTQFIGVASIFRLTPCTEEVARAACERFRINAPDLLDLPARPLLISSGDEE